MHSSLMPNGMRLLVDPRGAADVVAIYLWINVGSADEPEGLDGAAHLVEHMVFKGTRSHGVGEVSAAIEAVGGDLNAWTSFEETVFHATVPTAGVGVAIGVLAEMLREARFDRDELERERLVVIEEIRGGEDDPGLVLSEATWAQAFPGHPYGRTIIGSAASVAAMAPEALEGFYRRHYQPANACLAVAGPVDVDAVRALAERHLGGGGPAPERPVRPVATAGRGHAVLRRGFEGATLQLAWPAPPLGHPDMAALDVLCMALGGGASSPLEARLRLREGLCLDAGLGYHAEVNAGLVSLHLHPREGATEAALAAAREELAAALAGSIPDDALERARAQILTERVFGRETVDGRANTLAFNLERFGSADAWQAYDAAVRAVDARAALRAGRAWLTPEAEVGVALLPDELSVAFGPAAAPPPPRPARSGVERIVLDNGIRLLLHPDGGEVAAVSVIGVGGGLRDRPGAAGLGAAWSRALVRGAGRLGAEDFSSAVERLAGGLGAISGRSSQVVRGEFVAPAFAAGLELVLDALLAPAFEDAEVERVREEMLDALDERDDHPEGRLSELVWRLAFGEHPWALPAAGTPGTVARISARSVRRWHEEWVRGSGLVVAVAGGFDPDRTRRVLSRALARVPTRAPAPLPEAPRFTGTRRGSRRAGREQAHLAVAWPSVRHVDPRQPAIELLSAVLGGQAGRLFRELREDRGLAYDVSASAYDGVQEGILRATVACEPDRLDEAYAAMMACVERARDEGLGADEVDRARTWLLGAVALDLQTAASRAHSLAGAELYGLGAAEYATIVRRRLEGVKLADVHDVARTVLATPVAVATVRPRGGR